jgi:hypothetical protein
MQCEYARQSLGKPALREYDSPRHSHLGEVAEWPNAPVLKTDGQIPQAATRQTVATGADTALPSGLPFSVESDPGLARIVAAWPTLPEAIRRAILALVNSAE